MVHALAVISLAARPTTDDAVQRAQSGELAAFEELYRAHAGRVYALCRRLAGDEALAQALTQDAFVRAWERLGSFRGDAAFGTWLHRLTVNLVLHDRRTRLRRVEREQGSTLAYDEPGERVEAGVDLERAIAGLPDRARAVFVLHEIEGYQHDEIAGMLGVAVGTCKAQLHRARQLLRRALG